MPLLFLRINRKVAGDNLNFWHPVVLNTLSSLGEWIGKFNMSIIKCKWPIIQLKDGDYLLDKIKGDITASCIWETWSLFFNFLNTTNLQYFRCTVKCDIYLSFPYIGLPYDYKNCLCRRPGFDFWVGKILTRNGNPLEFAWTESTDRVGEATHGPQESVQSQATNIMCVCIQIQIFLPQMITRY